ncbi:MAG: ATP-dependent DNA helicase RecG, partial [Lachnospiraceae bacterium]|nr:ATP-dependent DNA helicase RecG [Lachnospiraceae bacterium]
MLERTDAVIRIRGVGEKTAALMNRAGIFTVLDLLCYYPRDYETFGEPLPLSAARYRDSASVTGVLMAPPATRHVRNLKITEAHIRDEEGGTLTLVWFNMPYLSKSLKPGASYVFRGRLAGNGAFRKMQQPKIYRIDEYRKLQETLQPVYPLTAGLTRKTLQDAVKNAMAEGVFPEETLDARLRRDYDLEGIEEAVREIHFPRSRESLIPARRRLVFEEFYRFILDVRHMKETVSLEPNSFGIRPMRETDALIEALPYRLTGAQRRTLEEIRQDLQSPHVMNRLVQGDVGSGKTIVAFLAMYETALCGYMGVLMAPTEVLALQHYRNFTGLSEQYGLGLKIVLLTGSMTAKERREAYELVRTHRCDIAVGTHALIQEDVHFEDLALVITDEQHRFGVNQRKALTEKGRTPHVLVMSATPIPRTLAMILYGDLNISVMDELPKNRLPIKNCVVDIEYRQKAYAFIRKQAEAGHQAYVICPMVEASDAFEGENVTDYAETLSRALPDSIRIGILHGKMKNEEKEAVMAAFSRNEIQVLVATTVIEVGIDVPNATVILIENAERFGLAQLHQLRGRVGRGKDQSYCILVDTTRSEESRKRLEILNTSNDGFHIASEDLKLRGPGDFFGIRQSGALAFRLGDLYKDAAILKQAEEAAGRTGSGDLSHPVRT